MIDAVLAPANLQLAWEEVAENKGAPGVDQVSLTRWARHPAENLAALSSAVRTNTYRPHKPRLVYIPKKGGGTRTIAILTVTDRVLQRAVLRVIDDVFERQFLNCSHGYRARRSVRTAVAQIISHRDFGRLWVVDADIDNCFESLDHGLILEFFQETISDYTICQLVKNWLKVYAGRPRQARGIPLGAVISPLLCNIVLHRLDAALTRQELAVVRYADDFCIFNFSENQAKKALEVTTQILAGLNLQLEPTKTRLTHFEEGFNFLGVNFLRNMYTFAYQGARITVKNNQDHTVYQDYIPDGYRD